MASLTIGGEVHEIAVSARDLARAEQESMKAGGRPLMAAFLGAQAGMLTFMELEWILWAAWRCPMPEITARLEHFYRDGGTVFEVHTAVVQALLECGAIRSRAPTNGASSPPDPPRAGTSG
jgi:hypothetical protein